MKNFKNPIWLFFIAILFAATGRAQTATSCSTAASYTYPVTATVSSYTSPNYWFTVTTPGAGTYELSLVFDTTGTNDILQYTSYTGSCGSLTEFSGDSLIDDSIQNSFT
ncbi:MAG TPA: hypothetical protein VKG26_07615, partial [Bacteroidia bacterium]|nr:hypothetical protein [Bacteroidia bacterium]